MLLCVVVCCVLCVVVCCYCCWLNSFLFQSSHFLFPPPPHTNTHTHTHTHTKKKRVANFLDRPEIEGCLQAQCGLKLHTCPTEKCFSREEIPEKDVGIVMELNHWWYKERKMNVSGIN